MEFVTYIAHEAAHEEVQPGILSALGIDGKLLVVQAAAFLFLVWLLGRFVYPHLIKAIEARRTAIEAGLSHAKKADEALKKAEAQALEVVLQARKEADEIVARSQQEAQALVTKAEESAVERAERIVSDAHAQLETDVRKARQALRDETVKLVAEATEQIIGEKLDATKNAKLIARALGKEQA